MCTSSYIVCYSLTQGYTTCVYIIIYCVLQPDPGVHHVCVHHHIFCYSLIQEYITCVYIIIYWVTA